MTLKDSSSMRVFAGLPLPDRVVQGLYRWMRKWQDRYSDWRVVSSHVLHITLHFFGDIPVLETERLSGRMDDLISSPIQALLAGVGCFPEKGPPRVLFVGLDEGCEEIKALYIKFHELIRSLGYREDKREFVPHITIARRSRGVAWPAEPGRGVGSVRCGRLSRGRLSRGRDPSGRGPRTGRSANGRHAARLSLLPNDWRSPDTLSDDGGVYDLEEPFTIDKLILYESRLKPNGAEYIPLKQVPLL